VENIMERIARRDPLERAAAQRLLLAGALSVSLHGAAAWFVSGAVSQTDASNLRVHIAAPFAGSLAALSTAGRQAETMPLPTLNPGRFSNGFSADETLDPTYYPVGELDVLPAPLGAIPPLDGLAEGYVRVLARIDASGRVTGTRIFDSSATESENAVAMLAISRTPFAAARRNGKMVRSEVVIELR
jgi:TonB family protein